MKREKHYNFLFDWANAEKGRELENKTKEYLSFVIKNHSYISKFPDRPSDPVFNNYKRGTLLILKDAIDAIGNFLDYDEPQKNYLAYLLAIQSKYHNICLSLKKLRGDDYLRGKHRAASDLYKGLSLLVLSMIDFELDRLPGAINERTQFIPL